MRRLAALLIGALLLTTGPARAQEADTVDAALLVADSVLIEGETRLIAQGNVEALYDGTRLTATRIIYDQASDSLTLEGPVRVTDAQGNVLVAEGGTLGADLENGILRGARMVLDQQLQLASVEARRVSGRFTQLSKVAATSCQVCGTQSPLWQIRASRVVHDQEERQLYFENATLRIKDVPIFYIPYMRLPDPTLDRARGFLIPTVRSTTLLGFGIKTPYFIPIGDHRDITLTPYLSPVTRTLEARYRQAFRNGRITLTGAISKDTLIRDETRGYLFAEGAFDLGRDFKLEFDLQATTDEAYLSDYGYSGADRLYSTIELRRVRRDELMQATLTHTETLRDDESNATQPSIITDVRFEKRFFPQRLGGEFRLGAVGHSHYRYSDLDVDGPDDDTIVDGRDVTRVNATASWRNRWTLPGGLRAGAEGHLWIDRFWIDQDAASPRDVTQVTPAASVELRWPFAMTGPSGARYLLEPVTQVGWVGGERLGQPNDESTRAEFDQGNLLSLSRFPAADRRERGRLTAVGLRFVRDDPTGWSSGLTLGRVWRNTDDPAFSRSSGMDSRGSDWLIAGHLQTASGLSFSARGLLDVGNLQFSKAEARAGWVTDRMDLGASYLLLVSDPAEDRSGAVSEWSFDGRYEMTNHWAGEASWQYDLADRRFAKAALGLEYQNECAQVNFSVSRRFASSTNLEPSTDFGLTVALKGFSTGGSAKEYRRSCSN
ncbi:LPS-assembly protein LptD [Thalassococcus sp. BH17M4-6]|uniref:LPS-assembly protein LptD n=1 Tax=Thalassococcus sp. BH17M4-6 TaxID=3413148 RepID=UPI003BECCDAA